MVEILKKMTTMKKNSIPTTTRQAFAILDAMLTPEERAEFSSQSKSEFCYQQHFGLGLWIRNNWIYGPNDDDPQERELGDACFRMLAGLKSKDCFFPHPDMVSDSFLQRYYRHLKETQKK